MVFSDAASEPARGFGETVRRELFAGDHRRAPLRLERIRPERGDHPQRHVVNGDVRRRRRAARGQFLDDQAGIEPRQSQSAVGHGRVQRTEAEVAGAPDHVLREMLFLVPTSRMRGEFAAGKLPRRVPISLLVFGEIEVHCSLIVMFDPTADDSSNQRAVTVFVSV